MGVAVLVDLTKCVGCGACALACKEANGLPFGDRDGALSATTWLVVERREGVPIRRQCMHCLDPTCASVCPVAALQKTGAGAVVYLEERCIGCRYCLMACPFGIPKYEWDKVHPRVRKCILCYEARVSRGLPPACVSVCPSGAAVFGERERLIAQARNRLRETPERYVDHVYGVEEAGGTSVLYLSAIPFERLGFRHVRTDQTYPKLTWAVLSQLPMVVSVGGVLMLGIWWIVNRRITLAHEGASAAEPAKQDGERRP